MSKIHTVGITDDVAETLFITVYMRCMETRRPDGIIQDQDACRIVDSVEYDFSKYDKGARSQIGTCIRVRHFDKMAQSFIASHDDPVIVSLGCGLDSRALRIRADKGTFYNVDLPEVMELRDKLLPPDERNISLHRSMFDRSWAQEVRENHSDSPVLVIAEGVFMYFTEAEVRPVIEMVAEILSPGEFLFDACSGFGCRISSKHDTVKYTNARFRWALDDDYLPEGWAPNLHLEEVTYYMDKEKHRWDRMSKVMSLFPFFAKAFRMLHFHMDRFSLETLPQSGPLPQSGVEPRYLINNIDQCI